jgi:hypothetical protein
MALTDTIPPPPANYSYRLVLFPTFDKIFRPQLARGIRAAVTRVTCHVSEKMSCRDDGTRI